MAQFQANSPPSLWQGVWVAKNLRLAISRIGSCVITLGFHWLECPSVLASISSEKKSLGQELMCQRLIFGGNSREQEMEQ